MLSPDASFEAVKIDSKGRISIPAYLRRNFGLKTGSEIRICCDLRSNLFILVFNPGIVFGVSKAKYGQNGVVDSTRDCGSLRPGAIPGSGPDKLDSGQKPESFRKGGEYDR